MDERIVGSIYDMDPIGRIIEPVQQGAYNYRLDGVNMGWKGLFASLEHANPAFEQSVIHAMLGIPVFEDNKAGLFIPRYTREINNTVVFYSIHDIPNYTNPHDKSNAVIMQPDVYGGKFLLTENTLIPQSEIIMHWKQVSIQEAYTRMDPTYKFSLEDEMERSLVLRHPDVNLFHNSDFCYEGVFFRVDPEGHPEWVVQRVMRMRDNAVDAARRVFKANGRGGIFEYHETRSLDESEF